MAGRGRGRSVPSVHGTDSSHRQPHRKGTDPGRRGRGSRPPRNTVAEKAADFGNRFDDFRRTVGEPRGHDALVGALLEADDPSSETGVIFFNNVGNLHMCVHGTIGVVVTLRTWVGSRGAATPRHPGRFGPRTRGQRTGLGRVPSFRRGGRDLDVEGVGPITGDVAWGGNWFFLVDDHGFDLATTDIELLRERAQRIRWALRRGQCTESTATPRPVMSYHVIDHVEFFDSPGRSDCDSKNFVLCPGGVTAHPAVRGSARSWPVLPRTVDWAPGNRGSRNRSSASLHR